MSSPVYITKALNGWIVRSDAVRAEIRANSDPEDAYVFEKWESLTDWLHKNIGPEKQPITQGHQ